MAIIYSYPTVVPQASDLILGTDVSQSDKATKNFTIQSIVDIVSGGAAGLGAVLKINSNAQDFTDPLNPVNQPIENLTFINGTGSATFSSFKDGTMTIQNGTGTGFVSIQSTDFVGNLTGIVKLGSSIAGTADGAEGNNVLGVTQPINTNNKTLATTAFVQQEITDEDLDFRGDDGGVIGSVDLNSETLAIVGKTINAIKNINTDTTAGGTLLNLSLANDVTIADDLTVTDVLTVNGVTASNIIQGGLQVNNSGGTHTFRVKGQTNDNLINTNVGDTDAKDQVAIGKNEAIDGTRLDVAGLIQGTSIKSSGMLTAQAALSLTGGVNLPVGGYGLVNQVLTNASSPGVATSLVWTTPTVGTLTDVDAGIGIIIDKTAAAEPVVAIRYQDELVNPATGALNFVDAATAGTPVLADLMVFSDQENITTKTNVKKVTISDILDLDTSVAGTQYTLPVFATTTTLGDSIIKQDSGASAATVTGTLTITSTATASKFIVDVGKADANFRGVASQAKALETAGDISPVDDVISYPATSGTVKAQAGAGVAVVFQDGATENLSIVYPVQGQVVSGTSIVAGTTVASISGGNLVLNTATSAALVAGATLSFAASTLDVYTSGGNVRMPSFIPSTIATSKYLTNLPTPTSSAITANDTILAAMAKLQGQITSTTGLSYEGVWDASGVAGGSPDLTQASTKVNGHFYIVDTAGDAEPNGAGGTQLSPWNVGDWCIYVANGSATDEWQKLDQSNEVLGSGAATKIAKWTSTNTLGTGLISDDTSTVTIGTTGTGDFTVEGETTLGGGATNNTLVRGDLRVNKELNLVQGLGAFDGTNFIYGPAVGGIKPVLTSGGSSTTPPTWAIPTVGEVVSITGGDGIKITGTAAVPIVSIDYLGADNAILSATDLSTGTIALTDQIWFNDVGTGATANTLKYAPVSKLKDIINTYSWDLNVDGGTAITVADTEEVDFISGTGIAQSLSTRDVTTALRYEDSDNSGTIKNFIESAATVVPTAADFLIFGDQAGASAKNAVKKATIADIVDLGNETLKQVLANGNITDGTDIAVSAGDDITFTDTSKALFGDSNDLQIFHNPIVPVSIIEATGPLFISSDTNVAINKTSPAEPMAKFIADGAVELFYDNVKKFATTDTGINVTGEGVFSGAVYVNGGGIDIDNDDDIRLRFDNASVFKAGLQVPTTAGDMITDSAINDFAIRSQSNMLFATGGATERMRITSGGDVIMKGDLTVDGSIIHGGGGIPSGGSVSAKGGTFMFNEDITGNTGGNVLFSVRRPATGALALRLMLTSGDAVAESRTKIFDVCKSFGSATVFNKTIDSGPNTNTPANDFTISFIPSSIGSAPTLSASGQKVISGLAGGEYVVGMGIVCSVSGRVPAGAVVTEAVSGENQITIDQNLTGEINSSMSITTTSNDLIVCYATGTPATQDISVTLDLGFDNNTTATVSRKQ